MIPSQRHLFDIPEEVAYFNCAYMSPLSHDVFAAGDMGLRRKYNPWKLLPEDFFTESEATRAVFADMVNANADDIAIIHAASYGTAIASANIPLAAGQNIVLLDEQFPSNVYPWFEKAKDAGADIITIPRPADDIWTPLILDAITDKTGIVALPHCHWTDGGLIDLVTIGKRCREVGAALVVDATQSLGAMPFDVEAIQPDFLVAATYKWLLGPYSMGFLYVAPKWHDGRPLEEGWIQRGGSENFARLVDYRDDYQPGARRYDMGERANFALMPVAKAALDMIMGWGVENIQTTLSARNLAIADRARAMGLGSVSPDLRAGHFLGLRFPDGVPDGLAATLAANKVFVSVRGPAMRITPHVFNTDADVDKLFAVLGKEI
ncbi:MAG: aminotransferase class V-fold PLP-dependent enzyme [Alphaproteobacteria bacterium]|nr:aminotransferase class V-fold PLP-dependent enzyme [Alphaproteobacteria bacterium]MBT4085995.1 aminotransferase class V-fold PLP-dependent enzyme [Alphaproteobacteria bacterium]MBT4546545.1 aminotransferase class V-fold PLP-dependent enzyme [Alphaproteobacteria bacterium]MBT7745976.1 aminotransferase class V-fold PLP-dependent enzyme [Alphaproteobacteria bacterium]